MEEPKISIITVCFNSARTIERTILSVLGQNYNNVEYIIIDGESSDATVEIIKKYERKISYWCSEKDRGIYDAMNKGVMHASGDIVAFLNSDDYYVNNDVLKTVAQAFTNSVEIEILVGGISIVNEFGIVCGHSIPNNKITDINFRMVYDHPAMFVKRKLFFTVGKFDIRYRIAADYDWVLRAYYQGCRFEEIKEIFTVFYLGGISSKMTFEMAEEIRSISLNRVPLEVLDIYYEKINALYKERVCGVNARESIQRILIKNFQEYKKSIHNLISDEQVCIWGYGARGQECHRLLENVGYKIRLIIDNDVSKRQATDSIELAGARRLKDFSGVIVITVQGAEDEIYTQIKNFFPQNRFIIILYDQILGIIKTICEREMK